MRHSPEGPWNISASHSGEHKDTGWWVFRIFFVVVSKAPVMLIVGSCMAFMAFIGMAFMLLALCCLCDWHCMAPMFASYGLQCHIPGTGSGTGSGDAWPALDP